MAIGFLLSEGILQDRNSLLDVRVDEKNHTVYVTLANLPDDIEATFNKKTVTSGCGRGITFTDAANLKKLPPNKSPVRISLQEVQNLLKEFRHKRHPLSPVYVGDRFAA